MKEYTKNNRDKINDRNRKWQEKNKDKMTSNHVKYVTKIRMLLFKQLGYKCIICGYNDIRALQFDHINNDGAKQRKIHGNSQKEYLYYTKHLDEVDVMLQVLCCNCNWIKQYNLHKSKT